MSYTYIAEIKASKITMDSSTSSDLKRVVSWANANSILGDLIIISEGYIGADGVIDNYDHVNSWYNDH